MGLLVPGVLEGHEGFEAIREFQAIEIVAKPLPVGARHHPEPQFPVRQGSKRVQDAREQFHARYAAQGTSRARWRRLRPSGPSGIPSCR